MESNNSTKPIPPAPRPRRYWLPFAIAGALLFMFMTATIAGLTAFIVVNNAMAEQPQAVRQVALEREDPDLRDFWRLIDNIGQASSLPHISLPQWAYRCDYCGSVRVISDLY